MAERKAAIQMSLGLIVAVVFAVVLLTLAITWIQTMISDITGITQDLTQQAESKISETFAESNSNFAVWPPDWELPGGNGIKFKAGIKNNDPDALSHDFVINIIPASASQQVCDTRDIRTCNSPKSGLTVYQYMLEWTTVDPSVSKINPRDTAYKTVTIEVPADAPNGYYLFNVVACYDRDTDDNPVTPRSLDCEADSDNIWSPAEPITIKVE
jgi:hypothetical protein